jgi:hypothetical protein
MLEAEADQRCGAGRYERSQARQDTRAGSYERTLQTSAGVKILWFPKNAGMAADYSNALVCTKKVVCRRSGGGLDQSHLVSL